MVNIAREPSHDAYHELQRRAKIAAGIAELQHDEEGAVVLFTPDCHVSSVTTAKDQMTVELHSYMRTTKLGWICEEHAHVFGVEFAKARIEVLWEITDHWPALAQRYCQPDTRWASFSGRRKIGHKKK